MRVGEYPPVGGWHRLVPEKIVSRPTPKKKPGEKENQAKLFFDSFKRRWRRMRGLCECGCGLPNGVWHGPVWYYDE